MMDLEASNLFSRTIRAVVVYEDELVVVPRSRQSVARTLDQLLDVEPLVVCGNYQRDHNLRSSNPTVRKEAAGAPTVAA